MTKQVQRLYNNEEYISNLLFFGPLETKGCLRSLEGFLKVRAFNILITFILQFVSEFVKQFTSIILG